MSLDFNSTNSSLDFLEEGGVGLSLFEDHDLDLTRKNLYRASYVTLVESSHRTSNQY